MIQSRILTQDLDQFLGGRSAWSQSTWPEGSTGTADVTTWTIDPRTGLVTEKKYADPINSVSFLKYEYEPGGGLWKSTWPSSQLLTFTATHTYNPVTGQVTQIDYSDTTPDIEYSYDRIGRPTVAKQKNVQGAVVMQHDFGYVDLELRTESITGVYNKVITRSRTGHHPAPGEPEDYHLRNLEVGPPGQTSADYAAYYEYLYADGGRLKSVTGPGIIGEGVGYGYKPGTELVQSVFHRMSFDQVYGGTLRQYDPARGLVNSVENTWNGGDPGQLSTVSKYVHEYDLLNRRKHVMRTGTAFTQSGSNDHVDVWGYNSRNELASSIQKLGTDPAAPVPGVGGRSLSYVYDPIGSRASITVDNVPKSYATNNVNQYTTGPDNEDFTYDFDGNLKKDGAYKYTWNALHQLTVAEPKTSPQNGSKQIKYDYDYMGRRLRKRIYTRTNGQWPADNHPSTVDIRYVYDGWNVIMELDGRDTNLDGQPENAVRRKYTWGLDLSVSLQGAGGIGGLLAVHDTNGTPSVTTDDKDYAYFYDTNGNVGQMIDMATGTTVARYEYDPYGQSLLDPDNSTVSGTYAATNPFRFSTKYCDTELNPTSTTEDMYYYGFRYYLPRLGRWINRDPFVESGGINLYAFSFNDPINGFDYLGLKKGKGVYSKCNTCKKNRLVRLSISAHLWFNAIDFRERDIREANDLWEQCCISIRSGRKNTWSRGDTEAVLGNNHLVDVHLIPTQPTAEELGLMINGGDPWPGDIRAHFVYGFEMPRVQGEAFSFHQVKPPLSPSIIIQGGGIISDVLAHEIGHILGLPHHPTASNLMADGLTTNHDGELLESQCDIARQNVYWIYVLPVPFP